MCVESELSMGNGSLGREWQLCPDIYFCLQCSSIMRQVSFNADAFSILIVTCACGMPMKGQRSNVHCILMYIVLLHFQSHSFSVVLLVLQILGFLTIRLW